VAARDTLLGVAAALERRDLEVAQRLERLRHLDRRVEAIRARGDDLRARIGSAPGRLAAVDRAHAEAREANERANAGLQRAERRLGELENGRRVHDGERERARHELDHARQAEHDAQARLERLAADRAAHEAAIAAVRREVPELLRNAAEVVHDVAGTGRVSETGRGPAPDRIDGIPDWASRVHAALFVVRGQLEQERERLVREANELGGSVLGEQIAGSSVALVRRRLEEALQP
jgi:DNA repair exonuclease SbcCD ATPase subunit